MMSDCGHRTVKIPSWWEQTADSVAYDSSTDPPPVVVVCGPGNSGKSLFSRLLLNTLLKRYKRVGYLDTDVGQPEFTTPGCLSFHIIDKPTPDLWILCLKTPERCFFYGDVNCQKDKIVYLNSIFCLFDYFHKEYCQPSKTDNPWRNMIPLVVNTSGWVKGAGYDLLVKMLRHVSPTHVVQIRVSAESKNLPRGIFWLDGNEKGSANSIEICAAQKDSDTRPVFVRKDARMLRDVRIIAYFRQCLPRDLSIATYKELVHNLAAIPAYELPLSKVKVIQLHCQDSDNVSHSSNAATVGLGISSCTPTSDENAASWSLELGYNLNDAIVGLGISSFLPTSGENAPPWCLGLGFVRGVNVQNDLLRIITPVPVCSLEKVDLIFQGCIEVPACLLQVQGLHKLDTQEMDAQMNRTEKQFSRLLST